MQLTGTSVKMTNFPTDSVKIGWNWLEIWHFFNTGQIYELKETESIDTTVKMTNFPIDSVEIG